MDIDYAIVRGLAYYTGLVFEVFDRSKNERALAGGGRYDKLLSLMSDGKTDLPALGFGMGDVVLGNVIDDTPPAKAAMESWLKEQHACDLYVIIAKEERRPDALALVQRLREAGQRVDFPLTAAKVGNAIPDGRATRRHAGGARRRRMAASEGEDAGDSRRAVGADRRIGYRDRSLTPSADGPLARGIEPAPLSASGRERTDPCRLGEARRHHPCTPGRADRS